MRIDGELPPANPSALGLHLTELEFCGVLAFLDASALVSRAWIYGSRHSGTRRSKGSVFSHPDIDLAVELGNAPTADDQHLTLARFQLNHDLREFFDHDRPEFGLTATDNKPGTVHLEFSEPGTSVQAWVKDGATIIFERK